MTFFLELNLIENEIKAHQTKLTVRNLTILYLFCTK